MQQAPSTHVEQLSKYDELDGLLQVVIITNKESRKAARKFRGKIKQIKEDLIAANPSGPRPFY